MKPYLKYYIIKVEGKLHLDYCLNTETSVVQVMPNFVRWIEEEDKLYFSKRRKYRNLDDPWEVEQK